MKVTYDAAAKINLMLDILARLDNGYHSLFMLMQSVDLYDTVTVETDDSGSISITSDEAGIPCDKRNIAYKAADAFFKHTEIKNKGIKIHLEKRIPFEAGMAGGSADGAAVIAALNDIYETNLSQQELCRIGLKVGADVPFCLTGGTCLAQNVGEILSPLPALDECYIVLAKPERGVSTKEAFAAFDTATNIRHLDTCGMLYAASQGDLYEICKRTKNVFEQLIEVPERVPVKSTLNRHGALAACMSGSGPTVYGIFDDESKAQSAASALKSIVKNIYITKPVKSGLVRR
ncbi:MAG: 4-(cytidine 5'-diphospho)-2-C-methyl-D-erythritol kinase [Acutalibacteraceae bacterium]|nr:4-(cytidine 5'-diphospho)-2-C-methyl-D-erythritol kinase [Acutalibacteraceae bacterium]